MPSVCRHCGGSELEKDPARCDVVCTTCGAVLEEGQIVSEVQFEEGGGGGSHVIGQFVSSDGTASTHLTGFGGMGYTESRTATLQSGKRHIEDLASKLRLSQHFVDIAFNFYKQAVVRRITRGHRLTHIIAACLYLACRVESTQHMLLDFSDALQADVYALGHAYLFLTKKLAINPPALDPCIYVSRFAHRLELGAKTHAVSMTALRLVSRMKKDWLNTGRRPSGLCGAALLIAARIHGFNRSTADVVRVVKVCQATLLRRLLEFSNTESSNLTVEEFRNIDLEEEEDPPAFAKTKEPTGTDEISSEQLDQFAAEIKKTQTELDRVLSQDEIRKRRGLYRRFGVADEATDEEAKPEFEDLVQECEDEVRLQKLEALTPAPPASVPPPLPECEDGIEGDIFADLELDALATADPEAASLCRIVADAEALMGQEGGLSEMRVSTAALVMTPTAAAASAIEAAAAHVDKTQVHTASEVAGEDELDSFGIDDGEIDAYLLKPDEVELRTLLWTKMNSAYLKEAAEKAAARQREEEEDAADGTKSQKSGAKPAKRRRKILPQASAGQAIEVLVQRKKLSSKIDYEKLKSLTEATTATPPRPGPAAIEEMAPVTTIPAPVPTVMVTVGGSVVGSNQSLPPVTSLLSRHIDDEDNYDEDDEDAEEATTLDHGEDDEDAEGATTLDHGTSAFNILSKMSGGSYAAADEND